MDAGILTDASGARALTFQLPDDLVGPGAEHLKLAELPAAGDGFTHFSDGETSAACAEGKTLISCMMKYPESYASTFSDEASTETFLKQKYAETPDLLRSRLEAERVFRYDPEGVVVLFK